MSALERRSELMKLAEMLNDHRKALAATIHEINEATALLVNEADKLLPAAADEREGGKASVTKMTFGQAKVDPQLEYIAAGGKQRTCSNCKQKGHTARTCTNERAIEVNDEGDVVAPSKGSKAPKAKRKMKPLTPERKAALAQQLVKARAARGTK